VTTAHELPVPLDEPPAVAPLRLVPAQELDFDEAVRRVQPRLHRYAVRRLGDVHEAEEMVQEALLRAYSHRGQLLTEDDLAAWATVVTGRLVIDRLRVRGRSTPVADVPEPSRVGRDTADVVVARDEARLALDSLDAMPPRQAALLWAREVEGSSYDDLCTRFGMSEPAVRSVLTRARKALRKEYAARGGTLPVGGLAVLAPWVVGLTWAEKLRRTATRVSTPAALSALGLSALGGLVLSPFGLAPHDGGPRFRPAPAVAAAEPTPALRAATSATLPAAPRAVPAGTATSTPPEPPTVAQRVTANLPCDAPGSDPKVSVTGNQCATNAKGRGAVLFIPVALPANPTGSQYVTLTSDYVDCRNVPVNPLLACTPEPTQQGVTP
jgi:RNA polymerase sigma-70 factor (ECF subfamily)